MMSLFFRRINVPHWSVVSLCCFDAGTSLSSFHQNRAQLLIAKCCGGVGDGGTVPKTRSVFWVSRLHEDKIFLHLLFTEATAKNAFFFPYSILSPVASEGVVSWLKGVKLVFIIIIFTTAL